VSEPTQSWIHFSNVVYLTAMLLFSLSFYLNQACLQLLRSLTPALSQKEREQEPLSVDAPLSFRERGGGEGKKA